jgi:hypothetical protein
VSFFDNVTLVCVFLFLALMSLLPLVMRNRNFKQLSHYLVKLKNMNTFLDLYSCSSDYSVFEVIGMKGDFKFPLDVNRIE